jgi:hypothetical protein
MHVSVLLLIELLEQLGNPVGTSARKTMHRPYCCAVPVHAASKSKLTRGRASATGAISFAGLPIGF